MSLVGSPLEKCRTKLQIVGDSIVSHVVCKLSKLQGNYTKNFLEVDIFFAVMVYKKVELAL